MNKEEVKKLAEALCETLGKELKEDISKFLQSVFEDKELNVGERDGYELVKKNVVFSNLMMFDNDETVVNDKYKPEELIPNDGDFYFASEEIARFNTRDTFFGIIGKKWLENELGDEFAEAIIFGSHKIGSIDCMLGSVRVNNPFNASQYLAPGTLVSLRKVEFKNTKYLEVATFLTKIFTNDGSENVWNLGGDYTRYFWNGESYTQQSNYLDDYEEDEEYYDDDEDYDYHDDYDEDYGGSYNDYPVMCELCSDAGCCLGIANCGFQ